MYSNTGLHSEEGTVALQGISIKADIYDYLSEVTVEQLYQNKDPVNIEAVYTFPLPLNAVLLELTMEINGRSIIGQISPSANAEEVYEDAITDGNSAMLLQKIDDALYTINIGNLQKDAVVKIKFRYAELHYWQGNQLRFFIPTVVAERYGSPEKAGLEEHQIPETDGLIEHRYSMILNLHGATKDLEIECPTHKYKLALKEDYIQITPSARETFLDRDFILNLYRSTTADRTGALFIVHDKYYEDMQIMLSTFQPNIPISDKKRDGRSLKIVVDCLGSM